MPNTLLEGPPKKSPVVPLEYSKDIDPRQEIFQYAIAHKWIIIEKSPHSANLESVFRNLTVEEKIDA